MNDENMVKDFYIMMLRNDLNKLRNDVFRYETALYLTTRLNPECSNSSILLKFQIKSYKGFLRILKHSKDILKTMDTFENKEDAYLNRSIRNYSIKLNHYQQLLKNIED